MSSTWEGRKPRILLSSVFGPYAQDDEFGSRSINPMELYHNQVTRSQGPFSIRMFHRSWGIMMIQANITAPCAVLDFPTRDAFAKELKAHHYDIVGISSIIVNVGKVKEMCRMVRELSPGTEIIVGGHVAAIPGIEQMVDADHVVKGEGIAWMRRHLGEDESAPLKHPLIKSAFGRRFLGLPIPDWGSTTAATIIPSVGCPMGCNFCTTSSFFGGKGKHVDFFKEGDDLFEVMREAEAGIGTRQFFVMDENFLLNRKRAMQLLSRMKQERKSWEFSVFSSANAIRRYTMEELVELGISWIWMGLESPNSTYAKLNDADTIAITSELRRHGIRVLGSTIIGLEHHTPENIKDEIEFAVRHNTDFHQFMLYTPVPGTPLHKEVKGQGRLIDVDLADIHGQYKFNFKHPAISRDQSKHFLDYAFNRDFERNGPSIYRICRTTYEGWKRYGQCADARIRARFEGDRKALKLMYASGLWAMERTLRQTNQAVSSKIQTFREEFEHSLGPQSSLAARLLGPVVLWTTRREERRMAEGRTYEPATFLERMNWAPDGA
ncbi:MAG: radical SAM protein [Acidobacteria bacterium]|nr:radical SAM protein [Acidobacteriota bacterium]